VCYFTLLFAVIGTLKLPEIAPILAAQKNLRTPVFPKVQNATLELPKVQRTIWLVSRAKDVFATSLECFTRAKEVYLSSDDDLSNGWVGFLGTPAM
jgi:hypothetical protein